MSFHQIYILSCCYQQTQKMVSEYFLNIYQKENYRENLVIGKKTLQKLLEYKWPGNIRELENCIERATILSTDGVIHGYHLPPTLQTAEASNTEYQGTLPVALDNLERDLIIEALKSTRGNLSKAAVKLGITERIMGLRIKKHDIDLKKYKYNKKGQ